MADLSLALLGTFEAVYDGRPLTKFRTKAVQALLIYLVCRREQAHAREALMALLWPELPTKSAQSSFRHALYHLRQTIPDVAGIDGVEVPFLLVERKTVQVNPDGRFQCDSISFEAGSTQKAAIAELETAVALYRADFLTDFYLPGSPNFENWVQTRRTDYQRQLLDALARLTDDQIKRGNFEQAEGYARRQLEIDNLREEAHQQLMVLLSCSGRRTAALTHYQTLYQLLQDELGILPSAATQALVETIRCDHLGQGLKGDDLKTEQEGRSGLVPNNLPPQATPFIGRQTELLALDELLAEGQTRLVIILGAGGMGKTRLSLAVAESQLGQGRFPQGIYFVPLAGLSESSRIMPAIIKALMIRLERGEAQFLNYFRNKEMLLVLDNFEHLLDGADLVKRLLQAAPKLQILISSRERLHLQGEQVYLIQGMALDESAVIDDARAFFLQAARRHHPDFIAVGEDLRSLNHICRLVEGMPLALELAAAWVDLLTLEDIRGEIQRNLAFLKSDLRDIPARHRSMQAVFDTSWQQLTARLKEVLGAAAVFRGSFTRAAAAAVAQASIADLAALVNKSLLSFDHEANRYHIHELLRQYSLTRISAAAARDRHCAYYLDLLVRQSPNLTGVDQDKTEAVLETEMNNIRAAFNHALRIKRLDNFVLLMRTLAQFYDNNNRLLEGIYFFDHIRTALSAAPDTHPRLLFWATALQVNALHALGHNTDSDQLWLVGQKLLVDQEARNLDIRSEKAFAAYIDGHALYGDQPGQARELLQQSYELALEIGDLHLAGKALIAYARAARNQGDLTAAEATAVNSLTLFQTVSDPIWVFSAQILLGELAGIAGRYDEAEQRLLSTVLAARQNHSYSIEYALVKLQMVYFFSGRFKEAAPLLAESRQLNEESGFTWGLARTSVCLGLLHLHEGRYTKALEEGQKALNLGQQHRLDFFTCEALTLLAQVQLALGNYWAVKQNLQESDRLCPNRSVGKQTFVAGNHLYWGIVEAALGQTAAAQQHLLSELAGAGERKDKLNLANALAAAAFLYAMKNESVSAVELYTLAQQHPFVANSRWFADVVGKRVTAVRALLSPEAAMAAAARGETLDMWETADSLRERMASGEC